MRSGNVVPATTAGTASRAGRKNGIDMQSGEPRYSVQVLIDAAGILGSFGSRNTPLGIAEISDSVGIGRSKVHRLLDTLRFLGFVEQDQSSKKYRLGLRTFELAAAAASHFDLGPGARQALQELVRSTGETVNVGVLQGTEILYVDNVRGFGPLRLEVEVGTRAPANCVAMGKAILAFEAPDRVEQILSLPLPALTRNSISDPERLRDELGRVRERGYALDDEESFPGVRCVAVPIFHYSHSPIAAIAVSGPAARLPMSRLLDFVQPLKETAEHISSVRD
ncbi:MAG TPA: IclR family transcriptional regulator [Chloroflexota bacterium]